MYNLMDDKELVAEIQKIDNKVTEELSKEQVDNKKVYELRFQQLMKGIQLTQNPYNIW